jgi:hypothetical protein
VYLLINGNTMAWQNKKWEDIYSFKNVQKQWAIAGLAINVLMVIPWILLVIFVPVLMRHYSSLAAQTGPSMNSQQGDNLTLPNTSNVSPSNIDNMIPPSTNNTAPPNNGNAIPPSTDDASPADNDDGTPQSAGDVSPTNTDSDE